MNVMIMFTICAQTKDQSTFLFSREIISLSLVSNPMQTNASEKKTVENIFATPLQGKLPSPMKASVSLQRLNTSDASTKPIMNLGNFSQTMPNEGRELLLPLPSAVLLVER